MALFDLVRVRVTTTGTGGPLQLGIADGGGRTFAAAGVPDGVSIPYGIADGGNRETGRGIYSAAANTLTRIFGASTTGTPLNLSGNAVLEITPLSSDFAAVAGPTKFNISMSATWIILHGFGRLPMAQVFLTSGEEVIADMVIDETYITVTHASPVAGFVIAN